MGRGPCCIAQSTLDASDVQLQDAEASTDAQEK
jgi:hypothetical protein